MLGNFRFEATHPIFCMIYRQAILPITFFVFVPMALPIVIHTPGVVPTSPDVGLPNNPIDVKLDDYYSRIPWGLEPFAQLYTCVGSPSSQIKCGDYIHLTTPSIQQDEQVIQILESQNIYNWVEVQFDQDSFYVGFPPRCMVINGDEK